MSTDTPDTPGPPLRVRYHPRRIGRARSANPLTPAQALHLPHDPARAALAHQTADARDWTPPQPPPPTARTGPWRRLWQRLTGRG